MDIRKTASSECRMFTQVYPPRFWSTLYVSAKWSHDWRRAALLLKMKCPLLSIVTCETVKPNRKGTVVSEIKLRLWKTACEICWCPFSKVNNGVDGVGQRAGEPPRPVPGALRHEDLRGIRDQVKQCEWPWSADVSWFSLNWCQAICTRADIGRCIWCAVASDYETDDLCGVEINDQHNTQFSRSVYITPKSTAHQLYLLPYVSSRLHWGNEVGYEMLRWFIPIFYRWSSANRP